MLSVLISSGVSHFLGHLSRHLHKSTLIFIFVFKYLYIFVYTKNHEFIMILPLTVQHHRFHSRLYLSVFAIFSPPKLSLPAIYLLIFKPHYIHKLISEFLTHMHLRNKLTRVHYLSTVLSVYKPCNS